MEFLETLPQAAPTLTTDGFLQLFERGCVAMLIENGDGTIVDANPIAWELLGSERRDLVGRHASEVLPPRMHREHPGDGGRRRGRLLRGDGRPLDVEMMCVPLVLGLEEATLISLWEVADRNDGCLSNRPSEEEGWRSVVSQLADEMVAEVSPLAGFASLLRAGGERGVLKVDHLDEVVGVAERLGTMATGLHRCAGHAVGELEEVAPSELIDSLQDELAEAAGGSRELRVELAAGLPKASCRVEGLRRLLAHVVERTSACQLGGGPVTIKLSSEPREGRIMVTVGAGENIAEGEALDVSLTNAAALAAGAEIQSLGEGGWQIVLPATEEDAGESQLEFELQEPNHSRVPVTAQVSEPVSESTAGGVAVADIGLEGCSGSGEEVTSNEGATRVSEKKTVLVVEDEEMVRDLVKRSLGYLGYEVLDACNGEEGLQFARQRGDEIDMVFSDIVMPRMSGPEMVAKMQEEGIDLPVLYTTGFTDNKRLLDNGEIREGVNLLPKPYTTKVLAERVGEVLGGVVD